MKRVPMNFAWPLKTTWGGYLNPHYAACTKCPDCDGTGYSPAAKRFSDEWYGKSPFDPAAYGATPLGLDHPGVQAFARRNVERDPGYYGDSARAIDREARRLWGMWRGQWSNHLIQADVDALVAGGRLMDFTRRPRTPEQAEALAVQPEEHGRFWMAESNGYTPTADEVNAWSLGGMGHDAINQWICVEARCVREGVQVGCPRDCGGEMWSSPEAKKAAESWAPTEPPIGDGYQLWETTSEGSPTSPVFATIEALCSWCAVNATTFGSATATAEQWRAMLDDDFVSHVETMGGGVTAVFI